MNVAGTISLALGVLGVWVAVSVPCGSRAGPFDEVDQLDVKLVRGQSTTTDVRQLLGKPDGKGDGRFPPAWVLQEIWLYEERVVDNRELRDGNRVDIEVRWDKAPPSRPTTAARLEADVELRSLFVLFTEGRFAGYYWYGYRTQGEELP